MEVSSKTRVLSLSLLAISSVMFVETTVGLLVGSLALLSDAVHAALDVITTLILLLTTRWSLKPPDEEHLYGHAKIESIGGLVGGVILVVLSAVIIIEAGFRLWTGPIPIHPGIIGFGAVFYTLLIDLFRIRILSKKSSSVTVKADLLHALSDFSSTVIALIGISLASIGFYSGDVMASLVLGGLLIFLSARLIRTASLDLTDAVPRTLVERVRRELETSRDISGFKGLMMRRVGSRTYVDVAVNVPEYVTVEDAHSVASKLESNIGNVLGDSSVLIHVEPVFRKVPLDLRIKKTSMNIEGVRDVHNINIHHTSSGPYVTLHIQVDPKASLSQAHIIAEQVEAALTRELAVKEATIHIESFEPETSWGRIVHDPRMSDTIDRLVKRHRSIRKVSKTILYVAENRLHINVSCSFRKEISVERLHDIITTIEDELRRRFEGASVTIHAEPDEAS